LNNLKIYHLVFLHFTLFIIGFIVFTFFQTGEFWNPDFSLKHWDSLWYESIKDKGYILSYSTTSNCAFFPFFPMVWRFLGVGYVGISLINSLIFLLGLFIFYRHFKIEKTYFFLYLSIPTLFFFCIAYSESIFFLFSVFILIALDKQNFLLLALSILFAASTRSASTVFVPAGVFLLLYNIYYKSRKGVYLSFLIMFSSILALILVYGMQYHHTGNFFAFFEAQKHWEHKLSIPKLPIHSWDNLMCNDVDGAALLISIFALMDLFYNIFLKRTNKDHLPLYFSLLYMIGISGLTLIYKGGTLPSLGRYIFCSPFFLYYLYYFAKIDFSKFRCLLFFVVGILYYVLLWEGVALSKGFYYYDRYFRYAITLLMLILISNKLNSRKYIYIALYFIGLYCQIVLCYYFLTQRWAG
jgi:hypothetical protein